MTIVVPLCCLCGANPTGRPEYSLCPPCAYLMKIDRAADPGIHTEAAEAARVALIVGIAL